MEKKLKNVIGAPVGKMAVAYVTHMELKCTEELVPEGNKGPEQEHNSRVTSVFEWLRQLLTLWRFYKRKDNHLVSVKDIFTSILRVCNL
jgi:hypothetical protein